MPNVAHQLATDSKMLYFEVSGILDERNMEFNQKGYASKIKLLPLCVYTLSCSINLLVAVSLPEHENYDPLKGLTFGFVVGHFCFLAVFSGWACRYWQLGFLLGVLMLVGSIVLSAAMGRLFSVAVPGTVRLLEALTILPLALLASAIPALLFRWTLGSRLVVEARPVERLSIKDYMLTTAVVGVALSSVLRISSGTSVLALGGMGTLLAFWSLPVAVLSFRYGSPNWYPSKEAATYLIVWGFFITAIFAQTNISIPLLLVSSYTGLVFGLWLGLYCCGLAGLHYRNFTIDTWPTDEANN